MSLMEALHWRYAAKRMDGRQVPRRTLDTILEAASLAPSSYGLQPYSVLVVEDPTLRERIRHAACDQPQVSECSHLLIFAAWAEVDGRHVDELVALTAAARGIDPEELEGYRQSLHAAVAGFATPEARHQWAARQAYIALGTALTAAAAERIDASPMEGFDPPALDALLGLEQQGLRSVVLLALGYRDTAQDRLAGQAKVRWPRERFVLVWDGA
ncbi:NAD(P)H-dependent oxidoreductase [Halomonas sp. MCCC 1A17488]|uniref:NAD(P)H-dependent oxidoreductase n=1 Tax=Billgrantia sulfidoxydans TaxID=2733484 RepID=A0ABX7W0N2_9GAMM|nr:MULTISPECIES: nitroreductase family protein [Halomonas]MCE8016474.1 NAD(P)H-dependent oxidoreductase [Halomonas sp. MCCC 1A17488]MCG3239807.1 NAD(P)H-dependent oxidoreductase [Halomonas sp. MCCC 1A17488]QPP50292.1 nitroreductase family protein [Halomonas sp. SS10-MC5]QTP53911.1 NAD(P)H-dependent oxidoreductase [Halomonas sulfidoxydans]